MIPAIASAFATAYPETTLHLREGSIEEQIDGIRAHDVDVAMFHLDPENRLIEIGVEQYVIASAPQFVFTSATVGNAGPLATALAGVPVDVIDDDGAPSAARVFVLWDRGLIRPGLNADVTVFDPDRLDPGELDQVDDFPGGATRMRRLPQGVACTIVNGEVLIEEGEHTGALPGRVARH